MVQAGDHFGFTWKKYGVVSFEFLDEDDQGYYCDKRGAPDIGEEVQLNDDANSNRLYSIQPTVCGERVTTLPPGVASSLDIIKMLLSFTMESYSLNTIFYKSSRLCIMVPKPLMIAF